MITAAPAPLGAIHRRSRPRRRRPTPPQALRRVELLARVPSLPARHASLPGAARRHQRRSRPHARAGRLGVRPCRGVAGRSARLRAGDGVGVGELTVPFETKFSVLPVAHRLRSIANVPPRRDSLPQSAGEVIGQVRSPYRLIMNASVRSVIPRAFARSVRSMRRGLSRICHPRSSSILSDQLLRSRRSFTTK